MPWYAIYTRPRHEKTVNGKLLEKEFDTYLPLVKRFSLIVTIPTGRSISPQRIISAACSDPFSYQSASS